MGAPGALHSPYLGKRETWGTSQLRIGNDEVIPGLGGINREAIGIPSETQYVEAYCQRRNLEALDHWPFYLSFRFFRLAAILQGVLKRSIDGNASSAKAQSYGALAQVLAEMGAENAFA